MHAGVYSFSHHDGAEFEVLPVILVCDSNQKCGKGGKVASGTFRTITAEQAIFEDNASIFPFDKVTIRQDWPDFAILPRIVPIQR